MNSTSARPVNGLLNHLPHWRLGNVELNQALREVIDGCVKDDVMGLAAELTYRCALTVFPFLLMVAAMPYVARSVLSLPDAGDTIGNEVSKYVSESSANLIRGMIKEVS